MVTADEARLAMVTAKFSGFIQKLDVRTSGESVEKGQRLLTAWVENGDLINQMIDLAALARDPKLGERAKNNLRLFDVPESDIEAIAKGDAPKRTITFNAPLSGTVLDKPAVDGMRFNAGDMLFRIADLSEVWVIAQVPEQDLAVVREGQTATLTLPAMPGETLTGAVDFIYPELDMETRSGRVRLRVPNPDGRLKLGLFAHAIIQAPVDDAPVLAVPASAVIDDGERARVFVAKGGGLFEPREIETGVRAGEHIAVKNGLAEGEDVVVNGTFLIDAESNLQAALAAFTAGGGAR
jgi:Cu(I)/Ag(I) efflux system membrane fusion protein